MKYRHISNLSKYKESDGVALSIKEGVDERDLSVTEKDDRGFQSRPGLSTRPVTLKGLVGADFGPVL